MKAQQETISLTITRREGRELRGQIIKLTNGTMDLYTKEMEGTPIAQLFELLGGNFDSTKAGVNFIE